MADQAFNPNVPFVEGTPYLNWSREITPPTPNRSGEIIGKGIGEGLKSIGTGLREGAAGINAAIETGLKNDVYAQGDALMNKEINNLYQVYAGIEEKPSEIKSLPNDLKTITDARDNGKISNTHHDGLLDQKAKELRARYPGYRQEVDEHFRAATGRGSTANQLYESIRGDIDAAVAARKEGRNKVMTELWGATNAGISQAPTWMKMYESGKLDDVGVANKLAGAYAYKYQNAQDEAAIHHLQLQKDQQAAVADQASKNLSFRSNHLIQDELNNYTVAIQGQNYTLSQLEDKVQNGEIKISPDQAVQLRQIFDARKGFLQNQIRSEMFKPNEKGESLGAAIGEERFSKELTDAFKTWDLFPEFLLDGKFSMAKAAEVLAKAQSDETRLNNQNDPEIGQTVRQLEAMKGWPANAQNVLIGQVIGSQAFTDNMKAKLLGSTTNLASPPHEDIKGGYKTTLATELDKAQQNKLPPQAVQILLNTTSLIGNTKIPDPIALNLVNSIYGVNSEGVVGKFSNRVNKDGSTDANEVFKTLTNPKNTKRIWKLGQEYPKVWDNYQTYVENEWHSKNLQDLKDLNEFAKLPGFGIKFDTETNEFEFHREKVPGEDPTISRMEMDSTQINRARQVIRRVNDGIRNMKAVYQNLGVDVSIPLIKLLYRTGSLDPQTITGKMMDAMESSYGSTNDDPREGADQ